MYRLDGTGTWTVYSNGTQVSFFETYTATALDTSALGIFTSLCGAPRNATVGVPVEVLDCLSCVSRYRNVITDVYEFVQSPQATCVPTTANVTGGTVSRRDLDDPYGKTILPKRKMDIISWSKPGILTTL